MTGMGKRDERTGVGRHRANAAYVAARASRDVWPRNEKTGWVGMSDERTGADITGGRDMARELSIWIDSYAPESEVGAFIDALADFVHDYEPRSAWDPIMTANFNADDDDVPLLVAAGLRAVARACTRFNNLVIDAKYDTMRADRQLRDALEAARWRLAVSRGSAPVSAGEPKENANG